MSLNRTELQQLADVRLAEANALLAAGLWDGAYYLAGYAVECALKACILRRVEQTGVIFEDKKFAEQCWTHNLDTLVGLAELRNVWKAAAAADALLDDNWKIVVKWNEGSRYKRWSEAETRELLAAVHDPNHGVLTWVKRHW